MYCLAIQRKENSGKQLDFLCDFNFDFQCFNKKKISIALQLDCGIHPGLTGVDALPFIDMIDCEEIDILLITQ